MLITFLLPAILVALDQLTKFLATKYLLPVGIMPLIPGVIDLRYVLNDGAAFSLFSGNRFILIGVTSVALLALLAFLLIKKPSNKLEYFSWLLIFAGGIGNLIDRVSNGVVVDFFNFLFVNFAVFNVADIYVTCGVALLFIAVISSEYKASKLKKASILQSAENKAESAEEEPKNDAQA